MHWAGLVMAQRKQLVAVLHVWGVRREGVRNVSSGPAGTATPCEDVTSSDATLVCGGSPGGVALLWVRCVGAGPAAEGGEALHAVGIAACAAGRHGALLVGAGDGPPPAAAAAAAVRDGGGASGGGADRQGGQDKARCLHAAPREGGAGAGGVGVPGLARPFPPSVSTAALERN